MVDSDFLFVFLYDLLREGYNLERYWVSVSFLLWFCHSINRCRAITIDVCLNRALVKSGHRSCKGYDFSFCVICD